METAIINIRLQITSFINIMKTNIALFLFIIVAIGFTHKAGAQANNWHKMQSENIASGVNIVYESLLQDGRLFAGTTNGLYVKLDSNATWVRNTSIPLNRQVTCFTERRPGLPAVGFLGTDSGYYTSLDSGNTWHGPYGFRTGEIGPGVDHVYDIKETLSGNVFFATSFGLYEEPYGQAMQPVPALSSSTIGVWNIYGLVTTGGGGDLLVEGSGPGFKGFPRSTDDGVTWIDDVPVVDGEEVTMFDIVGRDGGFFCAYWNADYSQGLAESGDRGVTWTPLYEFSVTSTVGGPTNVIQGAAVTYNYSVFLLTALTTYPDLHVVQVLHVSEDGGITWNDVFTDTGIDQMSNIFGGRYGVYIPFLMGDVAAVGDYPTFSFMFDGVGLSNGGITSIFASNIGNSVVASECQLPLRSQSIVNDYATGIILNGPVGWENLGQEMGNVATGFLEFPGTYDTILIASDNGVSQIVNNNPTLTLGYGPRSLILGSPYVNVNCLIADGHDVYAATDSGIFRSMDAGSTWSNIAGANTSAVQEFQFLKKLQNGMIYSADGGGNFYTSTDWITWNPIGNNNNGQTTSLDVDQRGWLYAASDNPTSLDRSTDSGQTWTSLLDNPGIPNLPVHQMKIAPNNDLVVCDSLGVFESSDHGDTWFDQSGGLLGLSALCIGFSPNGYGYVGTDGYGCFKSGSRFVAAPVPAKIQLTAPVNGYVTANDSIFFSWVGDPSDSTYYLDLAADAGFTNIILNGYIPGFRGPSMEVIVTNPGTYYWRVRGTNDGGDGPYSDTWQFTVTADGVGIPANVEVVGNLYPNPTSGAFTAQLPADFGNPERIVLLDEQGKTINDLTHGVTLDGLNLNCKLPPLPDGAYFFRVEGKTQALVYKVLVKR